MIETLNIQLPREVTSLHQIEITSQCNLRCVYCPSPKLGRPKMHMLREQYIRALEWAEHFVRAGSQTELNLAGIGESTMHPDFVEYVGLAREAVGPDTFLHVTTNGLLFDEEMAKACNEFGLKVFISLHRPEKAQHAVAAAKKYNMLVGLSIDAAVASIDWAGQVDWPVTTQHKERPCFWLRRGLVMAMADGRLTTCCLDASGIGVVGHINDKFEDIKLKPYTLCKNCDQQIGIERYNQVEETYG